MPAPMPQLRASWFLLEWRHRSAGTGVHVIVRRGCSQVQICASKKKLTSNFGRRTRKCCIRCEYLCIFCLLSSDSEEGSERFSHTQQSKISVAGSRGSSVFEHLYAGLRIMMNICARFAATGRARHDRTRRIGTLLKFGLNQPTPQGFLMTENIGKLRIEGGTPLVMVSRSSARAWCPRRWSQHCPSTLRNVPDLSDV